MSVLNDDVREIVEELDADGGGYQTSEASNLLVHRYVERGVCTEDGTPKTHVRELMRLGASVKFKNYKTERASDQKKREQAAAAMGMGQRDFQETAEGFDHEWVMVYAAYEETETASRKMLIRMTLAEVLAVIYLKEKKASEAIAVARRLRAIIDDNPHWHDNPSLTLADILGIHEP